MNAIGALSSILLSVVFIAFDLGYLIVEYLSIFSFGDEESASAKLLLVICDEDDVFSMELSTGAADVVSFKRKLHRKTTINLNDYHKKQKPKPCFISRLLYKSLCLV